jgi:nitrite reductase (NO-forming)
MSSPTLHPDSSGSPTPDSPESVAAAQKRLDFEILAPLAIIAIIVAVLAVVIAIYANQQDSTTGTLNAAHVDPAATSVASDQAAGTKELKADFKMKTFDPKTAPVEPGDKTFELIATEKNIEIDGKVRRMWTFNNTIPGPALRAVVGDTITIKIKNAEDSQYLHSVDYHASRMTLGGGGVQVAPGKEGEFTFKLEYPGVFMYHCATAPVLHHIGMGMYGMLIVQPKEGFGPEMPEYSITQSELYDTVADLESGTPDAMAFNGIPNQYSKDPIEVKEDSDVRLFVLNAGPSEQSSFHVIGTIFDRVFEDGNPRNVTYGRQVLGIATSGGGVFEMKLKGEGLYPFVTHQFDHASMGAIGVMVAGDGKPGPGAAPDPSENGHH